MTDDDPEDGRPIDAAEAWSCAAGVLYLLGLLLGGLSIREPQLALSSLRVLGAASVARMRSEGR